MPYKTCNNAFFCSILLSFVFILNSEAFQQNKTHHIRRPSIDESSVMKKIATYRSFQPIPITYHKPSYPKAEQRGPDYDINSYDTEYGGVVSNFTSSMYDDNPPLYPNPEILSRSNQGVFKEPLNKFMEGLMAEEQVDVPDESLADGDLKEHNIIDSVTYVYGFNACHGGRNEWIILIFITSGLAIILPASSIMWLRWSDYASKFRHNSKLYEYLANLCCSLITCTVFYIQAIIGSPSPSQCERIALLLHYNHISSAIWIVSLAAAVAEYCVCDTILPIKYNYLLAYGVPAVVVMFNYALSIEQYETKNYCWMSIEKGMLLGFMAPAMILILINTAIVIVGLQSVNKKQTEILSAKIQHLVEHHFLNVPKNEKIEVGGGSVETLNNIYPLSNSRKNTDCSDTLEKEFNFNPEEYQYGNVNSSNDDVNLENGKEAGETLKISDKSILNELYLENLVWKWSWNNEGNSLKAYLNLCLVLEPFFAINWMMGVVAIENATHWSTPTIYLILVVSMHIYLAATICSALPIINEKGIVCEEIITDPAISRIRTTDSIPLLDPAIQHPNVTPAPADTISTISI